MSETRNVTLDIYYLRTLQQNKTQRIFQGNCVKQVIGDNVQAQYDYLILACPLLTEEFMELTPEEERFSIKLKFNPYAVTSFEVEGKPLKERVVFVLPGEAFQSRKPYLPTSNGNKHGQSD